MISRILGAIKKMFGGSDSSDFEDAQTDPGVETPAPAPKAEAPAPPPAAEEPAAEEPAAEEPAAEEPAAEEPAAEEPAAATAITIKGVDVSDSLAVLNFANNASEDDLKAAGVKGAGLKALLGARPVASAEALGSISGFGKKIGKFFILNNERVVL